jgi:hypothetical protein
MDLATTIVGGGAIAGILYACWNYVKIYLMKIYNLFFITVSLEDEQLRIAGVYWLIKNCRQLSKADKHLIMNNNFIKPINKNGIVAYETLPSNPSVYFYKKIPFIASFTTFTFIRFTVNPYTILENIVHEFNLKDNASIIKDRFYIRKFNGSLKKKGKGRNSYGDEPDAPAQMGEINSKSGETLSSTAGMYGHLFNDLPLIKYKREEVGQPKRPDPLEYMALSNETIEVVKEIKRWKNSEEWFKEKQIPFKRGLLCYSTPGNGKSSFAKSLAMELNIPIMIFNLNDMSNTDFLTAWDSAKSNSPCMVLFEDIDAIFNGRKNVAHEEGGLSFDCFLNALDGVESASGILLFITTNNLDKIDPALGQPNGGTISTRPGRIDRVIQFSNPDENGRKKIANRILNDFPHYIDEIVKEGDHDTGAQFQERCSRLALKLFWENKDVASISSSLQS